MGRYMPAPLNERHIWVDTRGRSRWLASAHPLETLREPWQIAAAFAYHGGKGVVACRYICNVSFLCAALPTLIMLDSHVSTNLSTTMM
jgi:hypothetical protein